MVTINEWCPREPLDPKPSRFQSIRRQVYESPPKSAMIKVEQNYAISVYARVARVQIPVAKAPIAKKTSRTIQAS
jgi:hypothetical protein